MLTPVVELNRNGHVCPGVGDQTLQSQGNRYANKSHMIYQIATDELLLFTLPRPC